MSPRHKCLFFLWFVSRLQTISHLIDITLTIKLCFKWVLTLIFMVILLSEKRRRGTRQRSGKETESHFGGEGRKVKLHMKAKNTATQTQRCTVVVGALMQSRGWSLWEFYLEHIYNFLYLLHHFAIMLSRFMIFNRLCVCSLKYRGLCANRFGKHIKQP